jgi:hypothetical protein
MAIEGSCFSATKSAGFLGVPWGSRATPVPPERVVSGTMKLQIKREALVKLNRMANAQNVSEDLSYGTARVN